MVGKKSNRKTQLKIDKTTLIQTTLSPKQHTLDQTTGDILQTLRQGHREA